MSKESLYDLILANIKNGNLSENFSLSKEQQQGDLVFADGTWDGICRYNFGYANLDASSEKLREKALMAAAQAEFDEADRLFSELGKKYLPINAVDDFQAYIIDNAKKFPIKNVYDTAVYLVRHSHNKEAVKFGIEMLELISCTDNQTKAMIRNIGLSDEFTIFALWVMQKWENGNREVFELAKKVRNWGKIHAVEALSPDTQEIRDWLFQNGVYNGIMNSYSALTVWEKADVSKRLLHELTDEEFTAATDIIEALLNEGPVSGISGVENAETHIMNYLNQTKRHKLSAKTYEMLLTLYEWSTETENGFETVKETVLEILHSQQCQKTVMDAIREGDALRLAVFLEIPYSAQLLQCMKDDFSKHFYKCRYLMNDPQYVEAVVSLFEEKILSEQPHNELYNDKKCKEDDETANQLDCILQELNDKPFVGIELVLAGLNSSNVRNRNMALRVLQGWTSKKQLSLKELHGKLYETVKSLRETESDNGTGKIIEKLLNGEICLKTDNENEDEQ